MKQVSGVYLSAKKKQYEFGKTLGAGTFGIVRSAIWKEADPPISVAVKVIAKKNLRGHYDIVSWDPRGVGSLTT